MAHGQGAALNRTLGAKGAALDCVYAGMVQRAQRGWRGLQGNGTTARKERMKASEVAASVLQTAKEQIFPGSGAQPRVWRAYTRTGKIVVILDKQVLDIIDPTKELPLRKEDHAK